MKNHTNNLRFEILRNERGGKLSVSQCKRNSPTPISSILRKELCKDINYKKNWLGC